MDRSTLNKIFVWGMIFAKLRDRSSPLSGLEITLIEAIRDVHYQRTIALLKLLQDKPRTLKQIARRLKISDRVAQEFITALGQGGFTIECSDRKFKFNCESDRALTQILQWESDR